MSTERFRKLQEIFDRAAGLPETERRSFLEDACGDDHSLRDEIESLLAADRDSGRFMETPPEITGAGPIRPTPAAHPDRVGAYKVLRKIGEGGMSEVFLAVRADDEYQKSVALKIVRGDLDREDLVRRFRIERQILAGLDHPNIARLLDGGTTEQGLPYFVMEYIDGVPVDQHCDDRRLTLNERLDLFQVISAAVHYAHQNLVVHRDIKASNILVDAQGVPKLLDFGIAKLLKPDQFAGDVDYTATWMRPMTPRYASPEQIQGRPVTTSSDVYSLGVLLYKLLTGHLPHRFEGHAPGEFARVVIEQEPERPSTSVSRVETDPGGERPPADITPAGISRARHTQLGQLRRQLAGDLDNIILMAIRKEPQRRYSSVEQFADDIRRHREGLPVMARPDTLGYRTSKFIRRNRWAVAGSVAFMALLLTFTVGSIIQARRVAEERDQARRERDRAEQVTAFLEGIFEISDPFSPEGDVITAREVLERGTDRLQLELTDQPETRATLMDSIGRVYGGLGLYDRAEPLIRGALETRVELLAPDDPLIAGSQASLGNLLRERGELEAAEPLLTSTLEAKRQAFGDGDLIVANAYLDLAKLRQQQGQTQDAEQMAREALRIYRQTGGDELGRSAVHVILASLLLDLGRDDDAETEALEALRTRRRVLGEKHTLVAEALNDLGVFYGMRGDFARSEPLLRDALDMRLELLGDEHPTVAEGLNNLGMLLKQTGNLDEAEQLYREALAIHRHRLGNDHPKVAIQIFNLARLLQAKADLEEAEPFFREALDIRRRVLGDDHYMTALSLTGLGGLFLDRQQYTEAETTLREALDIYSRAFPERHWRPAETASLLGQCLAEKGEDAEAEPLLLQGYEILEETRGPEHSRTRAALARVVTYLEDRDRTGEAARYRARMPD